MEKREKILIIVPTINLVNQLYSDFEDYSSQTPLIIGNICHKVYQGQEKYNKDKNIIISTWQSIFNESTEYFKNFDAVIFDECHLCEAKSLKGIMTKLKSCDHRTGFTGTLKDSKTHKLIIEGLFGKAKTITQTKKLMETGELANLNINCIVLNHTSTDKKECHNQTYHKEMDILVSNKERNTFLQKLSTNLKGNTLVLFQYVQKHGKILYDDIKNNHKNSVYFIHGGVEADEREQIRQIMEKEENAIIVASYGTFSTGVNIKNLHNIIFASPSKAKIRIIQSIGRGLRKTETKTHMELYDVADNLSWNNRQNYTLKHLEKRIELYAREKFDYKLTQVQL